MQTSHAAAVDLYWIPLGAGGHSVRFNGRVFEAIEAARQHRPRCELYHAALVVECDGERHTIEVAPSPDGDEASRGVVGTGAVGSRHLGRLRLFRYEVRCWRGGSIPDLVDAVGGPRRLTSSPRDARRLLDLVVAVPRPVWGRDELESGRDVELELGRRLADRDRRPAHGAPSPATARSRPGVGRGSRGRRSRRASTPARWPGRTGSPRAAAFRGPGGSPARASRRARRRGRRGRAGRSPGPHRLPRCRRR